MTWGKMINIPVMECYYISSPMDQNAKLVRGSRPRMYRVSKEPEIPKVD